MAYLQNTVPEGLWFGRMTLSCVFMTCVVIKHQRPVESEMTFLV